MKQVLEQLVAKYRKELDEAKEANKTMFDQQVKNLDEVSKMKDLVTNVHNSNISKTTSEAIEKMNRIIQEETGNPSPVIVALVGNAGGGKSHFMNLMAGEDILPSSSGGDHVTKVLFHVSYSTDYTMQVIHCNEKELRERCENTRFDIKNISPTKIQSKERKFTSLRQLSKAMVQLQEAITESDIYQIKLVEITAPIKLLKEFEIVDVPGLNSGDFGKIFGRLAVEAGQMSDRIVIFPNGFRSKEFPTDVFELVGNIFADPNVQKKPKSFSYCHGGRTLSEKRATEEFLECLNKKTGENIRLVYKKYLSNYFDFKFDDLPSDVNDKPANGTITFVENKKIVLEVLDDSFIAFPMPLKESKNFEIEFEITKLKFNIMLEKDRQLHIQRVTQELREHALICIPKLMAKSKFQSSKAGKVLNNDIMNSCHLAVKEVVTKLESNIKIKKCINHNLIKKVIPKSFLTQSIETTHKNKNEQKLIVSHLVLLEEHIRAIALQQFAKNSSGDINIDMQEFSNEVLPLFDVESDGHVIFATEMKGYLNELFQTFIKERNFEFEHSFETKFCEVKRDVNNSSVLKLPDDKFESIESMVSQKLISNSDKIAKNKKYRNDLSTMKISEIVHSLEENLLPVTPQSVIHVSINKNKTVVIGKSNKDTFDAFQNMTPLKQLLDHQKKTRIAPIFFFSLNGEISPLALDSNWNQYSSESLIFIVTTREHVDGFNDHVIEYNDQHENHQARVLSVHIENGLYSLGSLMNAAFDVATHFKFPIIHMIESNVGTVHEYISPLKEYITKEWSPIRFFRSSEAIIYKEINNLSVEEKTEIVESTIQEMYQVFGSKKLYEKKEISSRMATFNNSYALENIELFTEFLRSIDSAVGSDLEKKFKSRFFSKNKGRVACWDGKTRNIDKNKIYSRDGFNYMISNYTTNIETYFMPSIDRIRPVSDAKMTAPLPKNYESLEEGNEYGFDPKMSSFKTNLLSNGVGGFMHLGFKFQNARKSKKMTKKNVKRKNENLSTSNKKTRK